jgi:hypothetical protein
MDFTKPLTCTVDLIVGTMSGITHIKTIFSFLPGTGKHVTGNTLCSSNDCHATHSYLALFHDNAFYKILEEKSKEVKSGGKGRPENGSPYSYPMIRKLSEQKGMNTMKK